MLVASVTGGVAAWALYQVTWWPSELELTLRDRARVMRSVAWGQSPSDPSLAPAIIKLAERVLDRTATPDLDSRVARYGRWLIYAVAFTLAAGWVGWMVFVVVDGRVATALMLWGSVLVSVLVQSRLPEPLEEIHTNAELAKAAAQALSAEEPGRAS